MRTLSKLATEPRLQSYSTRGSDYPSNWTTRVSLGISVAVHNVVSYFLLILEDMCSQCKFHSLARLSAPRADIVDSGRENKR
jgi:hypothetical protein